MEPPEVRPQIMDLSGPGNANPNNPAGGSGGTEYAGGGGAGGGTDFLAQEMEDMVLVVVALADKILISFRWRLGTWWYTQELHRK